MHDEVHVPAAAVDPTGRFAAVEMRAADFSYGMACMPTLSRISYGMHVKSTNILVLCSQLPAALYDPLGWCGHAWMHGADSALRALRADRDRSIYSSDLWAAILV